MKRSALILLLVCEAVLLTAAMLVWGVPGGNALIVFTFPFRQAAMGLKALAGTGSVGAGICAALLIGVSLLPLIPALNKKGGRTVPERLSLVLLSVSLLIGLYGMAYPGVFTPLAAKAESAVPVIMSLFGLLIWSAAVLYAVLRLLRVFRTDEKPRLLKYLRVMLVVLAMTLTAAVVLASGGELVTSLRAAQTATDKVFAVLRFMASAIPYVFDVILTCVAFELIGASLSGERERTAALADRLAKTGVLTLTVTAVVCFLINLLQVLFTRNLSDVRVSLSIPVIDMVFVLIVLLLARLITENKQLRDDNDLFI